MKTQLRNISTYMYAVTKTQILQKNHTGVRNTYIKYFAIF